MKIILKRENCIGCGSCQALCPKYFELMEYGKAHLIGSKKSSQSEELEVSNLECIKEAAEACPAQIIHILKD